MAYREMAGDSLNVAQQNAMAMLYGLFEPLIVATFNKVLDEREQLKQEQEEANEEKLITTNEAAKLLDVDRSTLWRWNKERYLCSIKVGKKAMYRLGDCKKIMEG